jgi:ATP-dependent Zn protease
MVEVMGLGENELAIRQFAGNEVALVSESVRKEMDTAISKILKEQMKKAETILQENRGALEALRDLLLEKRSIRREDLGSLLPAGKK